MGWRAGDKEAKVHTLNPTCSRMNAIFSVLAIAPKVSCKRIDRGRVLGRV